MKQSIIGLNKYRCKNCKKVLFYGDVVKGIISKTCERASCNQINVIVFEHGKISHSVREKL